MTMQSRTGPGSRASGRSLSIAIAGSGLAGSVLAGLLKDRHRITVFERGGRQMELPRRTLTAHPFGLNPSFAYGLGGTTNLWPGGMVELLPQEMEGKWPAALISELPGFYEKAVRRLYGEEASRHLRPQSLSHISDDVHPAQMLYMPTPFLAAESGFFDNCEIRYGQRVERLEEKKGRVVVTSNTTDGLREDIFDVVILAAGGINSPLILKASGLGGECAGENFTDHPLGFAAKLRVKKNTQMLRFLTSRKDLYKKSVPMLKVRDTQSGLWSAFYLHPAIGSGLKTDPYKLSFNSLGRKTLAGRYLAALPHLRHPDFLALALEQKLGVTLPSSHVYVVALNEQEATGQGTVSPAGDDGVSIDWHISDNLVQALGRNLKRLADMLESSLVIDADRMKQRLWSGAHYSGCCRISADASTGVTDENLRVHGCENIFVCDGSVLPSTGASNTGLAIASLALRLAGHIRP